MSRQRLRNTGIAVLILGALALALPINPDRLSKA